MEESLITPKKWAEISRKLIGRNQHQAKNRFITVLSKDLTLSREKVNKILKGPNLLAVTITALENLKILRNTRTTMNLVNFYDEEEYQLEIFPDSFGHFILFFKL